MLYFRFFHIPVPARLAPLLLQLDAARASPFSTAVSSSPENHSVTNKKKRLKKSSRFLFDTDSSHFLWLVSPDPYREASISSGPLGVSVGVSQWGCLLSPCAFAKEWARLRKWRPLFSPPRLRLWLKSQAPPMESPAPGSWSTGIFFSPLTLVSRLLLQPRPPRSVFRTTLEQPLFPTG